MRTWNIKKIAELSSKRVFNKYDCIICIEGNRGKGKSTCAVKIANRLRAFGLKFNMHNNIVYDPKEANRLVSTCKHTVIMFDEMINIAHNRDFYNRDQKDFVKAINMKRSNCNVIIYCIPFFQDLDTQLKKFVALRLKLKKRGLAEVHRPIKTYFSTDIWDEKYMLKLENKYAGKKFPTRRIRTMVAMLRFTDLQDDTKAIYEKIKEDKGGKVGGQINPEIDDPKQAFISNVFTQVKEKKMLKSEFIKLCELSNFKPAYIRDSLNKMLKEKGDENRVEYYFEEAINKKADSDIKLEKKKAELRKKIIQINVIKPITPKIDDKVCDEKANNIIYSTEQEEDLVW